MLHMADFSFRTIAEPAEGQYKEKGSRFLAFAFPVETEAEIKAHILRLEKQFFDARHHCFAWILGADKKRFRAFDDGEPNHSAGDPILGQIRSRNLTNVVVIVVRYFGGTKLGVGGLIGAYKLAAANALDKAVVVGKDVKKSVIVTYDYPATAEIMRLIKEFDLEIQAQSFKAECLLVASCKLQHAPSLIEKLTLMKTLGIVTDFRDQVVA